MRERVVRNLWKSTDVLYGLVCQDVDLKAQGQFKSLEAWALLIAHKSQENARMYLQLPLRQWGANNVYLLVVSSCKVNIAENPIAVMGL